MDTVAEAAATVVVVAMVAMVIATVNQVSIVGVAIVDTVDLARIDLVVTAVRIVTQSSSFLEEDVKQASGYRTLLVEKNKN